MNNRLILAIMLLLFIIVSLLHSCSSNENKVGNKAAINAHNAAGFVGEQACQSCHQAEIEQWRGSDHDYAMKPATDQWVKGDFSDVTFSHNGEQFRFFKQDSLFMVETTGPDGKIHNYHVKYTFGWRPLQQYLIDFGQGKYQVLNISWDTRRKEWFAMNPNEDIRHGDWLYWTGGAMNWNTMCADCHSTNLKQNYIASADSFHTTWSSINVSCESCHGPGEVHVNFMNTEEGANATLSRIRKDLKATRASSQDELINQCAQCHSLREELTDNYQHEGDFMDHYRPSLPHPEAYFADGQILREDYVYASFLQSRMYNVGGIRCNDCHDSHTLKLKAKVTDNSLCMECHTPNYNTFEHHKHEPNTEASQCINCHMPGRFYMEVDFRRDHSFRIPRPDLSATFGTPNACNSCHNNKSADWSAEAVRKWYGVKRPDHFSEALVRADSMGINAFPELKRLILDASQPDIARATAIWYLGQFPDAKSLDLLNKMADNESELIRTSTAHALSHFSENHSQKGLISALKDSVRAVRVSAAEGIASFSADDFQADQKAYFGKAMDDYLKYLNTIRYFPSGQMNRGQFYEKKGETAKAMQVYRRAIAKDPHFNAARINLAYLENQQGNKREAEKLFKKVIQQEQDYGPAYYSLALLLAEQQQTSEALTYFEKGAKRMPDHDRLRYNWAIMLQQLKQYNKAEQKYLSAINLAPANPDYRYGICTLYIQQEKYEKALPQAEKLNELIPGNQQITRLLHMIKQHL